jgi:sodium transport system permease protein
VVTAAGAFRVSGPGGAALLELVGVGVPCVLYAMVRGGVRAGLALRRPALRPLVGAAVIGASMWMVLLYAVMPLQERVAETPPELRRALDALAGTGEPIVLVLVGVALVPAICEELLCRGILVAAFAPHGRAVAIVASAALFALLHLSPYRFVPTFLLGLSLGWVTVVAGSVVPAIVLHLLHNAAVVVTSRVAADVVDDPPWQLGVLAIAICALGHVCVGWRARAALK